MRLSIPACLLLIIIVFSGCSRNANNTDKQLATFSQTPHFIKSFLNTLDKGKFLIAEKGEQWMGGCVQMPSLPSRQFVAASMNNNRYELTFWQGGFVTTKKKLTIQYTDTTIKSYTLLNL